MNPVNSSPVQKPCSTKRNECEISCSQTYNETNAEKMIKLNDIPSSQLGTLSYINKPKDYSHVLNHKDIMTFKTLSKHLQDTNLANIPKLSNLTSEERENLTSTLASFNGFDEFLLTITDNKPATLIFDKKDIDIKNNIKDHKVIKKKT